MQNGPLMRPVCFDSQTLITKHNKCQKHNHLSQYFVIPAKAGIQFVRRPRGRDVYGAVSYKPSHG